MFSPRAAFGARFRISSAPRLVFAAPLAGVGLSRATLAEVHPNAAPVVEHYVEATGGRAACEAESTLHSQGRIEAIGLTGHWDLWVAAPDRWMRRFTLGSLRIREGFDGCVA